MKLLSENSSLIITATKPQSISLEALKEFNVDLPPENVLTLEAIDFCYNDKVGKNTRLHSSKVQWILECMERLNFSEIKKSFDSERIGIYINTSSDVMNLNYPSLAHTNDNDSIYLRFKNKLPPTYFLKIVAGITPGHIAIFHEIHGPTYTSTSLGVNSIFDKAKLDILTGLVDLAVIGITNIYDDYMTIGWHKPYAGTRQLSEGCGVFFLTKDNLNEIKLKTNHHHYFGFLDGLI